YGDLLRWALRAGGIDDAEARRLARSASKHPAAARQAFGRTLELRNDAYEVFEALATGRRPAQVAVGRLRAAATEALAHASLAEADGAFAIRWEASDDPDRIWWPVAYAGLELLLHGPLDRVKGCGGCSYLFLD